MSAGRDVAPTRVEGTGSQWGPGCHAWTLCDRPDLVFKFERMAPGTAERLHVHRETTQYFFCVRGRMTVEVDGTAHDLAPLDGIAVLPGRRHRVVNRGGTRAEFVVASSRPPASDRVDLPEGAD
jgi:mannose-6-phosphate isomerase-like protein (cupin superfamily)